LAPTGSAGEVDAADADETAARGNDTGEAAERAGLAGAVGTDKAEDLAGLDGERQITDGGEIAVAFGESRETSIMAVETAGLRGRRQARAERDVTAGGERRLGGIGQNRPL